MLPGLMSVTQCRGGSRNKELPWTHLSLQCCLSHPPENVPSVLELCSRAHLFGDAYELDPQAGVWVTAEGHKVLLDLCPCLVIESNSSGTSCTAYLIHALLVAI